MRFLFIVLLFLRVSICAIEADFDFVFVGSSPISMLEALYRSYSGSRVLVLESDTTIGGAWRSIEICNVPNVDMGCHQIGRDEKFRNFLEVYVGCNLVPMNNPYGGMPLLSTDTGLYFSKGCHELMYNIERLTKMSRVALLLNHKLESVYLDFDRSIAEIRTNRGRYTATKIIITPHSGFVVENTPNFPQPTTSKHTHLYLLIQDETTPRFTYYNGFCSGVSRAINITPFSPELKGSGHQLIAIQTYHSQQNTNPNFYIDELKKKDLIDSGARLITAEMYVYEQPHMNTNAIFCNPKISPFFEMLDTGGIWNIAAHTEKWEKVFQPYSKVILQGVH